MKKTALLMMAFILLAVYIPLTAQSEIPDEDHATGEVLFEEDFSDNSADWYTSDQPGDVFSDIADGVYRIELENITDWYVVPQVNDWTKTPIVSGAYEIEFTVSNLESSSDNYCVSIFFEIEEAYEDAKRVYICRDGDWTYRYPVRPVMGRYREIDFLNGGSYRMKLRVTEEAFTVYVNNQQILHNDEGIFPGSGTIGFGLARYYLDEATTISASFDDLIVREIDPGEHPVGGENTSPDLSSSDDTIFFFDPQQNPALAGIALDEQIDTGLGFTFWYPSASNWRPAEGGEQVFHIGYTMALDNFDSALPILEVYLAETTAEDLVAIALEKVEDYSRLMMGGFSLMGANVIQGPANIEGETIGIAGASTSTAAVFAFTKRVSENQVAVFRYISFQDRYDAAVGSGEFALVILMAASAQPAPVTNLRLLEFMNFLIIPSEPLTRTLDPDPGEVYWYFRAYRGDTINVTLISENIDDLYIEILEQATTSGNYFLPADSSLESAFVRVSDSETRATDYPIWGAKQDRYAIQIISRTSEPVEYTLTLEVNPGGQS